MHSRCPKYLRNPDHFISHILQKLKESLTDLEIAADDQRPSEFARSGANNQFSQKDDLVGQSCFK